MNHTQENDWSVDAWMFLVMFAGYAFVYHDIFVAVAFFFVTLILYLIVSRWVSGRIQRLAKFALLAWVIGFYVLGVSFYHIHLRSQEGAHSHAHDGLIQIEEATKFLLAGKNPYVENYTQTPLAQWNFRIGDLTVNPALYHNAYLPFFFLFTAPFYLLAQAMLGGFDARLIFLPMFLGVLFIVAQWVKEANRRYALVLFIALNPFFAVYVIEGRNDVFVLFWLAVSVQLLRRQWGLGSLITLGLACASKLTAWFLIPFLGLYLLQPPADHLLRWIRLNGWRVVRQMLPLAVTIIVIILPFFLWAPGAFIDDVWLYPNGTSALAPYPIFGYGFNMIVQSFGGQAMTASPFEFLQWLIGLPLLGVLMWQQIKHNTLAQMWFSYAMLLAVMGFFSHVLNDNHIGFILTLLAIAMFTDEPTTTLKRQVA